MSSGSVGDRTQQVYDRGRVAYTHVSFRSRPHAGSEPLWPPTGRLLDRRLVLETGMHKIRVLCDALLCRRTTPADGVDHDAEETRRSWNTTLPPGRRTAKLHQDGIQRDLELEIRHVEPPYSISVGWFQLDPHSHRAFRRTNSHKRRSSLTS